MKRQILPSQNTSPTTADDAAVTDRQPSMSVPIILFDNVHKVRTNMRDNCDVSSRYKIAFVCPDQ